MQLDIEDENTHVFVTVALMKTIKKCINQTRGYTGAWILVPLDVTDTFDKDEKNFDDIRLIFDDYDHMSGLVKVGKYHKN